MGTRCLTFVYDITGQPIVNLYRQYDGYPTGHGAELAQFLNSGTIVNGLSDNSTTRYFNGVGDLAAQMVAYFKQTIGNFYIYSVDSKQCGQDYEYHVYADRVEVFDCGCNLFGLSGDKRDSAFNGTWNEFSKFCGVESQVNSVAFDNNPVGQDWVKSILRDSEVSVTFTKKDGTVRVMKCTLNEDLIPQVEVQGAGTVKQTKVPNPDVQPVFDTEAQHWKSFRWDSVKSVEFTL